MRPGRPFVIAMKLLAGAAIGILAGSVIWVAVYAVVDPGRTPLMVIRGGDISHETVPLDNIAMVLGRSVIASEDARFCEHAGFDWEALEAAWESVQTGVKLRGGSTISMQLAKNVFLWPGRTFVRKGLEAWFTFWIEVLWSKDRILEVYLNVIELAPGVYGAEAGAQHHFGHSAAKLTAVEAGRMAASLPNPREYNAGKPGSFIRRQGAIVQKRVRDMAWPDEGRGYCPPLPAVQE